MDRYDSILCSAVATLAKILDPRFGNDVISGSDLLHKYVDIGKEDHISSVRNN